MLCKVDGCASNVSKRGYCNKHYLRWRRHGDPTAGQKMRNQTRSDFCVYAMSKVTRNGECLEWDGGRESNGYGVTTIHDRHEKVHRLICEHYHGPQPNDRPCALHTCDNPPCINPDHLYWGSKNDNARDRDVRGRNGTAKLSNEKAVDVRRLHSSGMKTRSIAGLFGVSERTVRDVLSRRSWRRS